jgi:phosphoglycolate phosphatase-like HAD superfamily hydrolase
MSLYFKEKKNKNKAQKFNYISKDKYIPLPSWNNCASKEKLIQFINNISNVPKEARIAVFDLDGTLFQETDPVYNDWKIYKHRILDDPNYIATSKQKEIANKLIKAIKFHEMPEDLNIEISYSSAEVFKNMTLEEYDKYLKDYLNHPADGYNNLMRGDAFFIPMLEVIDYLQKNDFSIYIISATDRFQVRTIIDGHINIPKANIIGSDFDISSINQGNISGFNYNYNPNEKMILKGELIMLNIKLNKVNGIIRNIGRKPILIFGNSEGDISMANYALSNNEYNSLAFMLICDDFDRERGNKISADKMKDLCEINNFIPISMKNDWKTIYGENVIKNNVTY